MSKIWFHEMWREKPTTYNPIITRHENQMSFFFFFLSLWLEYMRSLTAHTSMLTFEETTHVTCVCVCVWDSNVAHVLAIVTIGLAIAECWSWGLDESDVIACKQCGQDKILFKIPIWERNWAWVQCKRSLMQFCCPSFFAVQRPDEEEEDCWERQSKNPADHQGVGPEEEPGSQPGMAEGSAPCLLV